MFQDLLSGSTSPPLRVAHEATVRFTGLPFVLYARGRVSHRKLPLVCFCFAGCGSSQAIIPLAEEEEHRSSCRRRSRELLKGGMNSKISLVKFMYSLQHASCFLLLLFLSNMWSLAALRKAATWWQQENVLFSQACVAARRG